MGVHKNIKTPEILWQLFLDYKKYTKDNPRFKHVLAQKTATMVKEPLEVPLTKEGFYNYVSEHNGTVSLKDYFCNKEGRYEDFTPICSRICDHIRQDQVEGGMVGQYNPSITQRLNGITDKTEIEHSGAISGDYNHKVTFQDYNDKEGE